MRNSTLHLVLSSFTADAAEQLSAETAVGAEVPFELVETNAGTPRRPALYCYRPLTGRFIGERLGMLAALESYAPAVRALSALDRLETYLRGHGEPRIPDDPRERADAALRVFLSAVFAERSEFGFDAQRFQSAYAELERTLYEGRSLTMVITPILGLALDSGSIELALAEDLSLVRGDAVPDAPAEAVWADGGDPNVMAVLRVVEERSEQRPPALVRARFRRVLTALRLFEHGGYALGPVAWTRTDGGAWRTMPLGSSGRPRPVTAIPAGQEDELRAFCNLVSRRLPAGGELTWALARFELGCERLAPRDALTDYLLALRALLEPEGPSSARLAGRLAAICAKAEDRAALAERTAQAISLERAVIAGIAPAEPGVDALVEELAGHLRAILRDMVCGHLDADLTTFAEGLVAESAAAHGAGR